MSLLYITSTLPCYVLNCWFFQICSRVLAAVPLFNATFQRSYHRCCETCRNGHCRREWRLEATVSLSCYVFFKAQLWNFGCMLLSACSLSWSFAQYSIAAKMEMNVIVIASGWLELWLVFISRKFVTSFIRVWVPFSAEGVMLVWYQSPDPLPSPSDK